MQPSLYESGRLFHGPAFQVMQSCAGRHRRLGPAGQRGPRRPPEPGPARRGDHAIPGMPTCGTSAWRRTRWPIPPGSPRATPDPTTGTVRLESDPTLRGNDFPPSDPTGRIRWGLGRGAPGRGLLPEGPPRAPPPMPVGPSSATAPSSPDSVSRIGAAETRLATADLEAVSWLPEPSGPSTARRTPPRSQSATSPAPSPAPRCPASRPADPLRADHHREERTVVRGDDCGLPGHHRSRLLDN